MVLINCISFFLFFFSGFSVLSFLERLEASSVKPAVSCNTKPLDALQLSSIYGYHFQKMNPRPHLKFTILEKEVDAAGPVTFHNLQKEVSSISATSPLLSVPSL